MYIKRGHVLDGICDVVFWYMLVGGAIAYLFSFSSFTSMMSLSYTMPSQAGSVFGWIAIAGAVGILLTAGRDSRNWFKLMFRLSPEVWISQRYSFLLQASGTGSCNERNCYGF